MLRQLIAPTVDALNKNNFFNIRNECFPPPLFSYLFIVILTICYSFLPQSESIFTLCLHP